MSTELYEINVTLSDFQKKNLSKAFHNRETITLRLKNNALSGSDTLIVPPKLFKKLDDGMEFHLKYSLYDTLPISYKISVFKNIVNISKNL